MFFEDATDRETVIPMNARAWYRFQNLATDPTIVELLIFDDIGKSWWNDNAVSAQAFMDDLKALSPAVTTIIVRVNSLGGDAFDAIAIANALRDQSRAKGRTVETVVEGIAASAASIVIMAGSTIRMSDNALLMVHNASSFEVGNKQALRKMADALDTIDGAIVATYQWHSQLTPEALASLMDAETWMNADEAIANGLATVKIAGLKAAASINPRALSHVTIPEQYRDRVQALIQNAGRQAARNADPEAGETPEEMVAEAIGELQQVSPLLAGGTLDQLRQALGLLTEVEDEIDEATTAVLDLIDGQEPGTTAAVRNARRPAKAGPPAPAVDVLRLCREGGCVDLAEGLIDAGTPLAQVQARVTEAQTARAAAATRATEIRALCAAADQTDLADSYINGQMAPADVRAQLVTITAKLDRAEIDAGLQPDQRRHGAGPVIDVTAIYRDRNRGTAKKE